MKSLVGEEQKILVFPYGEAGGGPKLIKPERINLAGKEILGIEGVGMAVPESSSMEVIGAAFQADINHRSPAYTVFHSRIRLDVEFRDTVEWNEGSSRAGNGRLAKGRFTVITVVIGDAVNGKVVGSGPLSVDVEALETATWAALHARHAIQQIVEVPAVVRK